MGRERLLFLRDQKAPLSLEAVIHYLGPTPPTVALGGYGSYYGYAVAGSDAFVEFWLSDQPAEQPDVISKVVERTPGKEPRVIWRPNI